MSRSNKVHPSSPLDQTNEEPIELLSRIVHKFFEPVILLLALTEAVSHIAKPRSHEENVDVKNPEELFYAFVNKLSHACDREKGGDNVTSFAVLKDEDNPDLAHYVFAVNQQDTGQLHTTKAYVTTLLHKVAQAPKGQENQHDAMQSLLCYILRFNRPRVSFYLRELQEHAKSCLKSCEAGKTDDDELVAEELAKILASPYVGSEVSHKEADYFQKCETTIKLLTRIEMSRQGKIIEDRALEDRVEGYKSMECWADLFHTIRRILAYLHSVRFFLLAKEKWPNLFENFTVSFISSSRPAPKPFRNKSLYADGIVGRMTRKEKEIAIFRDFVRNLQLYNLDDRIKQEYSRSTFRPIVHAEVLLLNWISNKGEIVPSRFFNDWMYIGSSKPTCKLCDYYFEEHRSNVKHRASHGNLYPSWRVPDVFRSQNPEWIEKRQIMVDRILQRVRKDAFDVVRRKAIPGIKADDSNTRSARVTLWDVGSLRGSEDDVDDLASMLGQVDIG
ncbi:hypothetical protein TsFJ059_009275 [Trichoderma semiorbis]|uniref:C2H2-type domain-containing protein n=1 Tax=Trichoderma semiorbis TaxID=1491008 RepID=A0A9P8HJ75_9HYPO|nr:hypothetical protein TsFJ059_009275 [Trichoderma semiorbis]